MLSRRMFLQAVAALSVSVPVLAGRSRTAVLPDGPAGTIQIRTGGDDTLLCELTMTVRDGRFEDSYAPILATGITDHFVWSFPDGQILRGSVGVGEGQGDLWFNSKFFIMGVIVWLRNVSLRYS